MGDSGKVMLLPRGEYYSATPYEELDCVYYQGRSYVCKQASTGHAPTDTTYWQQMTPDASAEIQALTNYVDTEVIGARNYLDITLDSIKSANTDGTWNGNTYTLNGITVAITADSAGRIDNIALSGTASNTFFFTVLSKNNLLALPFATILNGGFTATSGANALRALSEDGATAYNDLGTGVEIPANFPMWVQIRLGQGTQAAFNVKPMIRKATDTNAEYVKYPDTLQALTGDVAGLAALIGGGSARTITGTTAMSALENGVYSMAASDATIWDGYSKFIIVFKYGNNSGLQIAYKLRNNADVSANIAFRYSWDGTYSNWAIVTATNQT